MSIKNFCLKTLCIGAIASQSLTLFASAPKVDLNNPLAINYVLEQLEDKLEKNYDKQFKVDWDFDILFSNGRVIIAIEYDKEDAKAFKQISKADLEKLLTSIISEIQTNLGTTTIPIEGIIKEDDAKQPTYTFMFKNGKLDIK
ncbi:hypothetical protein [Niameybacter massiliensis]|uniref:hypothetical protein n=1 Tax=Niameybacter massiliensis TaxID=1658108 RepID=UPI0006B68ACC|nr:hypothetical protein [Niameybacter massiliensis]